MAALSSIKTHSPQRNIADDSNASAFQAENAGAAPKSGKFQSSSFRSALLLKLCLMNILAFALVGAAWWEGFVDTVLNADKTGLSVAIFIVFLAGLGLSLWRALQINRDIDDITYADRRKAQSEDKTDAQAPSGALRMRLAQRIAAIRHIANTLVLLGLIGTVLGFIIALSGVDPDNAADVSNIAPMVSTLIQGMSTALYTTLIGSILNVWLMANYQILSGGTVHLMSLLLEKGNSDA